MINEALLLLLFWEAKRKGGGKKRGKGEGRITKNSLAKREKKKKKGGGGEKAAQRSYPGRKRGTIGSRGRRQLGSFWPGEGGCISGFWILRKRERGKRKRRNRQFQR